MLKRALTNMKRNLSKYRKIVIVILIVYAFWFFGLGIIGGWFLAKGTISSFPELKTTDRILILAPHIDDEIIAAGGLIQKAVAVGAKIKIVYITNGDDNTGTIIIADKNVEYDPHNFAELGESRMEEGIDASVTLGLQREDVVFLGYPDKGLTPMLTDFFDKPYTSKGTRFNFNPYDGTFSEKQEYMGMNVVANLKSIYTDFNPDIVIVPHPRDKHPDHRATYKYAEKVHEEENLNVKVYAYLVHYSLYPSKKRLETYSFMYPPKNLFTKEGWYSYDLSGEQQDIKLSALEKNESQIKTPTMGAFLKSFVRKNEIFELMN